MKFGIFSLLAIVAVLAGQDVSAAPINFIFQEPDARTLMIVNNLLHGEIAFARQSLKTFRQQHPLRIRVARTMVSTSEPPYLFIEILGADSGFCGNVNCSIWGYELTKHGWRKIFGGIGYQWTVLSHTQGAHHDISEKMHGSATEYTVRIFRWTGDRYQKI